jgi:hypothetical protein
MMTRVLVACVALAGCAAIAAAAISLDRLGPASADSSIDATGYWVTVAQGPITINCSTHIIQNGTELSWTGTCSPGGTSVASGTIDPAAGAFTASGTVGAIAVTYAGTISKDGLTTSGTWDAGSSGSGTFSGHQKPKPPTNTPTSTSTSTPTPTPCPPEGCPTSTPTFTPTNTRTPTNTPTVTETRTPTSTPSALLSVAPPSLQASRGASVAVQIELANVANLGAYEFTLSYDPDVLAAPLVIDQGFLDTTGQTVLCLPPIVEPGQVRFGCVTLGPSDGASGSGTLATVTLVTSCEGDGSDVTLESALLASPFGSQIGVQQISHGQVTLTGEPCGSPDADSDLDGCTDQKEDDLTPMTGGMRDHLNFWDFFDTPNTANVRDRSITGTDFFAVLARFGATGAANSIDPLSPPPTAPAYHSAFDRGPVLGGGDPWDTGAANGAIAGADFFAILAQFGHSCA